MKTVVKNTILFLFVAMMVSTATTGFAQTEEIAKTELKKGHYDEFKFFFKKLPKILPVPEKFVEQTNNRMVSEKEMTDGHEFHTKKEAFGLAAKFVREEKERIVWFKNAGNLYKVIVMPLFSGPSVRVREFNPQSTWGRGFVSVFRN